MQRPLQNDFGVGDKEISREGSGAPSTPQERTPRSPFRAPRSLRVPRSRSPRPARWRSKEVESSEAKVFHRLYRDASAKQEALARRIQEQENEKHETPAREASAQRIREISERMHAELRKQPCKPASEAPKSPRCIPSEMSEEQRHFIQKQHKWKEQRERRMEAVRRERTEAERKYLEDHSIHVRSRSTAPNPLACCDRLYKDSSQRARRLQRSQLAAQEELRQAIEAKFVHRAVSADATSNPRGQEVAMRLHKDFEDRRQRVEQKRQEQEESFRQRAQRASSKKGSTPRTPTVSPWAKETKKANSKAAQGVAETRKSSSSRSPASTTASEWSPKSPKSPSNSMKSTSTSSRVPNREGSPGCPRSVSLRGAMPPEKLNTSDLLDVEVGVVAAVGVLEVPGTTWYCVVQVAGGHDLILCTRSVEKTTDVVWNESVLTSIHPTDTLLFKVFAEKECQAEASLQVASVLKICSSGFEGKLRMWERSPGAGTTPHLQVTLRRLEKLEVAEGEAVEAKKPSPSGYTGKAWRKDSRDLLGATQRVRRMQSEPSLPSPVTPHSSAEGGLLASTSTFLPVSTKASTSRTARQSERKPRAGYEFEVYMTLPSDLTKYTVQIPGTWLPDHLQGEARAVEELLLSLTARGVEEARPTEVHVGTDKAGIPDQGSNSQTSYPVCPVEWVMPQAQCSKACDMEDDELAFSVSEAPEGRPFGPVANSLSDDELLSPDTRSEWPALARHEDDDMADMDELMAVVGVDEAPFEPGEPRARSDGEAAQSPFYEPHQWHPDQASAARGSSSSSGGSEQESRQSRSSSVHSLSSEISKNEIQREILATFNGTVDTAGLGSPERDGPVHAAFGGAGGAGGAEASLFSSEQKVFNTSLITV
ncbi:unnamed protein product [Symbiodinium natans]|uniref:C2 domain-containing protein n=1 Tax=Symbiodinium natans TaxID=878477 RepID=A0A812R8F9_9DINO|nr:unnamed protein product [Symbiodinium natans]